MQSHADAYALVTTCVKMIQIKIIVSYTYIHSSEMRSANVSISVSWMQNCPITTSPYRRCVFFYANIFESAHATILYGGFYYKTVRGHSNRLRVGGPGVEDSNLVGEKMGGFSHPIL